MTPIEVAAIFEAWDSVAAMPVVDRVALQARLGSLVAPSGLDSEASGRPEPGRRVELVPLTLSERAFAYCLLISRGKILYHEAPRVWTNDDGMVEIAPATAH